MRLQTYAKAIRASQDKHDNGGNKMNKHIGLKKITKVLFPLALILGLSFLSSCYAPSPLYGTWADGWGNKISFMADGTFNANTTLNDNVEMDDGTYEVLKNIIVFSKSSGAKMQTEWDIRGNLMYLTWIDNKSNARLLELMKISN